MEKTKEKRGADKRRHPRMPLDLSLDLRTMKGGTTKGRIIDISASGMSLQTNEPIDEGSVLCLKVDSAMKIRGEVRHIKTDAVGHTYEYGVRFHKVGRN